MSFLLIQFLTGLAGASSLFLVAAGLTVIFGVTRVVNFAHGSLFMLGAYIAWSILTRLPRDPLFFTAGVAVAALAVALLGLLLESTLLRHLYRAPELFQLLATFGVLLIVQDATPLIWGPNDLPLPRPPWLRAFVPILGERFPRYDLVLIALAPLVLALLWVLLHRTRFGRELRAATEDRDLAAALGVDQRRLFAAVFALGAGLAGLGGALTLPDASANLQMDLSVIVEAFVVVVVGGMGSIPGAFLASVLIGELQAFGIVLLPQATLVLAFAAMALVLVLRPQGLLGTAVTQRDTGGAPSLVRPPPPALRIAGCAALLLAAVAPFVLPPYPLAVLTEALVAMLFAASLHFMMGPGGMPSFGHAAWFGLGAYAAGLSATRLGAGMALALAAAPLLAGVIALLLGAFVVRLSGVYLAMLTLAFAQIVWAVATQASSLTGGDDGILGVWPGMGAAYYWVVLGLCAAATLLLRRLIYAPFGYALRAARDSAVRAGAIGLDVQALRCVAFAVAGAAAGLAGGVFAYAKGSVFPGYAGIAHSVDALLMVLLGGVQTVSGPIIGAFAYTWLYDVLLQATPYWRMALGAAIILLVLAFPRGLAGMRRPEPDSADMPAEAAPPNPGAATTVRQEAARMPLLTAESLHKSFDGIDAVVDVSFTVGSGEVVALIGPNGAGKTTCFNLLNGQLPPDAGRVRLGLADVTALPPRRIARLGVGRTFQVAATFPSMTVRESVQMALIASRREAWSVARTATRLHRPRADALLRQVGLGAQAERWAATLAYGDVKRLELAMALAAEPRLLLMDEPTAGMSPAERRALMALVRDVVQERGCTVLFTEHDMDVVFACADRILVMHRGRLIAQGTPEAIRADAQVRAVYLGEDAA